MPRSISGKATSEDFFFGIQLGRSEEEKISPRFCTIPYFDTKDENKIRKSIKKISRWRILSFLNLLFSRKVSLSLSGFFSAVCTYVFYGLGNRRSVACAGEKEEGIKRREEEESCEKLCRMTTSTPGSGLIIPFSLFFCGVLKKVFYAAN